MATILKIKKNNIMIDGDIIEDTSNLKIFIDGVHINEIIEDLNDGENIYLDKDGNLHVNSVEEFTNNNYLKLLTLSL